MVFLGGDDCFVKEVDWFRLTGGKCLIFISSYFLELLGSFCKVRFGLMVLVFETETN
jgi:hypothetical protein